MRAGQGKLAYGVGDNDDINKTCGEDSLVAEVSNNTKATYTCKCINSHPTGLDHVIHGGHDLKNCFSKL